MFGTSELMRPTPVLQQFWNKLEMFTTILLLLQQLLSSLLLLQARDGSGLCFASTAQHSTARPPWPPGSWAGVPWKFPSQTLFVRLAITRFVVTTPWSVGTLEYTWSAKSGFHSFKHWHLCVNICDVGHYMCVPLNNLNYRYHTLKIYIYCLKSYYAPPTKAWIANGSS